MRSHYPMRGSFEGSVPSKRRGTKKGANKRYGYPSKDTRCYLFFYMRSKGVSLLSVPSFTAHRLRIKDTSIPSRDTSAAFKRDEKKRTKEGTLLFFRGPSYAFVFVVSLLYRWKVH